MRGKKLTLHQLALASTGLAGDPGVFRLRGERLFFAAADGASLEVLQLQIEGKRRMGTAELLHGHAIVDGDRLGS